MMLLTAHGPSFTKTLSVILEGDEIQQAQRIERKGRFGAANAAYAVSLSGIAHCAWVRDNWTVGSSEKYDQIICYSANEGGSGWSEPIEIHKRSASRTIVRDKPGIACDKRNAYVMWKERDNGRIYFADLQNGVLKEKTIISEKAPSRYASRLWSKISVDSEGNVFALWLENRYEHHEMMLRCRMSGKWLSPVCISRGQDDAKMPDMAIDEEGTIHLTYLKGTKDSNFGCYYRMLTPNLSQKLRH